VASLYFRVPLEQIGYVRAIVEGYDGVAIVHAPDPNRGEVEWLVGEGLEDEAAALALRLGAEAGLVAIDRPANWPVAGGPPRPAASSRR
jgi:Domain of unknown function (DUF4911)